jgi:hypothetical protein
LACADPSPRRAPPVPLPAGLFTQPKVHTCLETIPLRRASPIHRSTSC